MPRSRRPPRSVELHHIRTEAGIIFTSKKSMDAYHILPYWDGKKFKVSFALDPFFTLFEAPVFPKQPIVWANEPGEADRRGRDQIVWKGRVINGGRRQREGKGSGDRFPPLV